jgi:EAL domain-containing protein (putative c-di-GMP-specific phosphodiesterase class I)
MHSRAVELLRMETELRRAIERSEFQVYYQPVVTLARPHHRLRGAHPLEPPGARPGPARRVHPHVEDTGMIIEIDRFVLREACRQLKDWRARLPDGQTLRSA